MNRVEPFIEDPPNDHPCHQQYRVRVGEDVTEREVQRATAAYYAQVEYMDRCFGQVLDTLEHIGALDDFVIMYWSDHGEMLGQHGLWEKNSSMMLVVRCHYYLLTLVMRLIKDHVVKQSSVYWIVFQLSVI